MRLHRSLVAAVALVSAQAGCTERVERPDVLEALWERRDYAALDEPAIEALSRAAEARWPRTFARFEGRRVERFSAGGQSHWISIWTHTKTRLEFALVPGGTFEMGSPPGEAYRREDERRHPVTLDPFLIARTECTQGAWATLAKAAGFEGAAFDGAAELPMAGMSPAEVEVWCRHAQLSLPTEAQWEFMCRAGTTSPWTMGDRKGDLERFANIGSAECPADWISMPGITEPWSDGYGARTAPVGSYAANAFGLFDVHGNVSEWTGDRIGPSDERIARGGNFGGDAATVRSAARFNAGSGVSPGANKGFGFRPSLGLGRETSEAD